MQQHWQHVQEACVILVQVARANFNFLLDKVLRIRSASSGLTIFHRVFAPCPFPFLALPTHGTVGVVHAAAMFGSCFW